MPANIRLEPDAPTVPAIMSLRRTGGNGSLACIIIPFPNAAYAKNRPCELNRLRRVKGERFPNTRNRSPRHRPEDLGSLPVPCSLAPEVHRALKLERSQIVQPEEPMLSMSYGDRWFAAPSTVPIFVPTLHEFGCELGSRVSDYCF